MFSRTMSLVQIMWGGVQKTHYTACVNHLLLRTVLQDDNIKASTQGKYTVWLPWGD